MADQAPDIGAQWKALTPEQRTKAMAAMSPEQKTTLATRLGYQKQGDKPSITATPDNKTPVFDWLKNAENDITQGGTRTGVGRVLGMMQGRGDKGFNGIEAGVSKEAGDMMGSPLLGATNTAQGIAEMKDTPIKGAIDTGKGILKAMEIPGYMTGESVASKAIEAIPSTAHAGEILNQLETVMKGVPVNLTKSEGPLMNIMQDFDAGSSVPPVIKKLVKRWGDNKGPITYDEARRFYKNITTLSSEEKMSMKPEMRRKIGQVAEAFKHDIGEAIPIPAIRDRYYSAMREYHRGSQVKRLGTNTLNRLKKSAPIVGAAAAGAAGANEIRKFVQ
ncbi:MAG TPA: hypothetical protein VGK96_28555 [Candidatus Sulfotelmatobacter sp.]|jgi:hypothetical protein